jgi:C4-dicarboxylate-specific signal transduction histidine kinase
VQVLVNLLRNALEMNLAGQSVSVGAHLDGAHVHIRVADRGPGLSQEAASRLFEPFFTTKPAGRGLGLGIAVSKMIVEEAGGHLNGGNRRDGSGAEFVITLMASTSVAPDAGDNE